MKKTPYAHILVLIAFLLNSLGPGAWAQTSDFHLPAPGVMVHLSPPLDPPMLKGIKVHPENPFQFEFILDQGDSAFDSDGLGYQKGQLKSEATKLIKYFLASLTIPDKDLWVNLSPYEKDRIIPQSFGLTEMGRDLLAEDYMLKQITASLIYPEGGLGKKFWKRVYEEAEKRFGTTNIPVNTFNKVWIVPQKAVVYENAKSGTAYVVESRLNVMLEQDYLSMQEHRVERNDMSSVGANIVREIVIPELIKEVNEGKNFAQLRQVYNSLILAAWYKKKIKDSILQQVFTNKNKTSGLSFPNSSVGNPQYIYQQYLKAFKKGVYNYIKEDTDQITQETIPRKYFSGGTTFDDQAMSSALSFTENAAVLSSAPDHAQVVEVTLVGQRRLSKNERTYAKTVRDAENKHVNALLDFQTEIQRLEIISYLKEAHKDYFEIKRGEDGFLNLPANNDVHIYLAPTEGLKPDSDEVKELSNLFGVEYSEALSEIGDIAEAQEASFTYPSMDAMTNLPNKEGYQTLIINEIQRQIRQGKVHIVILVTDLDRFKNVNDTLGHLYGDTLIKKFARALRNNTRATDIVAHWGGDEFVMVWPVTDAFRGIPQNGEKILQKIREEVYLDKEELAGTSHTERWNNTASIGAAEYENTSVKAMTNEEVRRLAEKIFEKADSLLYEAKKNGKDRIVIGKYIDNAQLSSDQAETVITGFVNNISETAYNMMWERLQESLRIKWDNAAFQKMWSFVKRDIMYQQEICVRAVSEFLLILKNRFQDSSRVRSDLGKVNIWDINYHEFIVTILSGKVFIIDPTYQQLIPEPKPGPSQKVLTVELSKLPGVASELRVPGRAEIWMIGLRQNPELWQKITNLPGYEYLKNSSDGAMTVNEKRAVDLERKMTDLLNRGLDPDSKRRFAAMKAFKNVLTDKKNIGEPDKGLLDLLDGIAAGHYYQDRDHLNEFRGVVSTTRFLKITPYNFRDDFDSKVIGRLWKSLQKSRYVDTNGNFMPRFIALKGPADMELYSVFKDEKNRIYGIMLGSQERNDSNIKVKAIIRKLIEMGALIVVNDRTKEVRVMPYPNLKEIVQSVAGTGQEFNDIWSILYGVIKAERTRDEVVGYVCKIAGIYYEPMRRLGNFVLPVKPAVTPPAIKTVTKPAQLDLFGENKEDKAQLANLKGGIDLTPSKMDLQLQNAGEAIKFHLDPGLLQRLQNTPGFVPVIINIHPMNDLRKFLGVNEAPNLIGA